MDSSGCSHIAFVDTCQNAFYFEGTDTDSDVCQDDVIKSNQCLTRLIRSKDNKFLVLNDDHFEGKDLTIRLQHQPNCKFNIHFFSDSTNLHERLVMLYANKGDTKMVACCSEKHEIYPKAMALPQRIEEPAHMAMFYLKRLSVSNTFMFESSLYRRNFLGFEPDKDNPYLKKLVLLKVTEVDERCHLSLPLCD